MLKQLLMLLLLLLMPLPCRYMYAEGMKLAKKYEQEEAELAAKLKVGQAALLRGPGRLARHDWSSAAQHGAACFSAS